MNTDKTKADPAKTKKLIVRTILVVLYVALALVMAVTGKRHSILVDNKAAEDGSWQALDGISVQIDRLEPNEYYAGDRLKETVKGPRHKIVVLNLADKQSLAVKEFNLPFGSPDMVILSVPKMLAGKEPWIEPFDAAAQEQGPAEAAPGDSMSFGGEAPAAEGAALATPAK